MGLVRAVAMLLFSLFQPIYRLGGYLFAALASWAQETGLPTRDPRPRDAGFLT